MLGSFPSRLLLFLLVVKTIKKYDVLWQIKTVETLKDTTKSIRTCLPFGLRILPLLKFLNLNGCLHLAMSITEILRLIKKLKLRQLNIMKYTKHLVDAKYTNMLMKLKLKLKKQI